MVMGASFQPYYSQVMPGLKMVAAMQPANTVQADTRAAGIRCIGNVIEACGEISKVEGAELFG